jgi:chromosome segregation ATPase
LVNLYNKSKESLRQALQQLDTEKKEAENLRVQLEQSLKETGPLRDQLDVLSTKLRLLQSESDSKDAQLKSARAYNVQLKAELAETVSRKDECNEQLQRECARLKKELSIESSKQTTKKTESLQADVSRLETENNLYKVYFKLLFVSESKGKYCRSQENHNIFAKSNQ